MKLTYIYIDDSVSYVFQYCYHQSRNWRSNRRITAIIIVIMMMVIIIIIIIIIIRDNEKRTCILIDVAISGDSNVIEKEAEKNLKYKDLTTEIQRM